MNKKNALNTRRAFTMAETLLTIMIIGVLVALMLRAINRINPDKDKVLFIKSYHALESVIASAINDPSKYDAAFYSDADIAAMSAAERAGLHLDFSYAPIPEAKVVYTNSSGTSSTKSSLSRKEAICYFIADQINTIGGVNCGEGNIKNFRTSNGVCFYNWGNVDTNGEVSGVIDTDCDGNGVTVNVFKDGKMTVPEGTEGSLQRTAYNWLQNQAQLN